jgi:Ca2+-transporting ATPase
MTGGHITGAHALPAEAVAEQLDVDPTIGLADAEASFRLERDGPNELEPASRPSVLSSLWEAATEPFVILLAVAGLLALLLGEFRDGLLILVGLGPIIGADVITTYRGERALEELRVAAAPRARVRREGLAVDVPARDLVEGDVVILRVGDVVPADVRMVRCAALTVDRSMMTGESLPEELSPDADPPATPLVGRHAVAYSGTAVVLGSGEGIVIATGPRTELGRIASGLARTDRLRSPLQRELDRLVRILLIVAVGLIAVTMGLGLIRGATLGEAVLAGISAAIAAIPEEPPVLLAVVLGLGAYRLLRKGVLVRRLNAQETLGSIDLIITDKTGTLTENRLALESIWTTRGPIDDEPSRASVILDALRAEEDAWRAAAGVGMGSFTRALVAAHGSSALRLDPSELLDARGPSTSTPFSFTRAHRDGTIEDLALGAPEKILELVDESTRPGWLDLIDRSASSGRRLLLLGRRRDEGPWEPRALLSFTDPLRPGIREALIDAHRAGIQVIVVTGDHAATAAAIAEQAGVERGRVVTGPKLENMSDAELARLIPELRIVARAAPEQKLRLVLVARDAGRTIAVTGDGVNDAPALKQSDVGVAMGSGTAVAREAADLVLGDDSFVTLIEGLREGRRIITNVQKGLVFLTSTHVALLGFILIATLAGFGQPLLPIQILWLELFIDLSASVAFEREPAEPDVMRRPPQPRDVPLLTSALLWRIALAGSVTALAALALISWSGGDLDHARWFAFSALVYGQLVRAYANRSLVHPLRTLRPNRFLAVACVAAGIIQFSIPYVPPLADAFRATQLAPLELAVIAVIAVAPSIAAEVIRSLRGTPWVA